VSARDSRLFTGQSPFYPPTPLFRPSELRKLKGSEQVAAVCYRVGKRGVEFLLVRTSGGRWTFPKGSVESGLTCAQSAALEAFEEAGVHGRMEEASFARYTHRREKRKPGSAAAPTISIHAHLCEVSRLGRPQEPDRKPTWFSGEKAKHRLAHDRSRAAAAEFRRVVDLALSRIRLLTSGPAPDDTWQKVLFERLQTASPVPARQLPGNSLFRVPRLTGRRTGDIEKVQIVEITEARDQRGSPLAGRKLTR
jgi:8-oxo-dGTP pyrophosphatase MutT (NUDIX family)